MLYIISRYDDVRKQQGLIMSGSNILVQVYIQRVDDDAICYYKHFISQPVQ